jgi:hypothetical protein
MGDMRGMKSVHNASASESQKKPLGKRRQILEDNIKTDFKGYEHMV